MKLETARGKDRWRRLLGLLWASISLSKSLERFDHRWDAPVNAVAEGGADGGVAVAEEEYYSNYGTQEDYYAGPFNESEFLS